jgi:hypothetical protein
MVRNMVRNRVRRIVKLLVLAPFAVAAFGLGVMALWNWVVPPVIGWREVTFWQALGLLLLTRIMVGGMGSDGSHRGSRRRIMERWEQMTPEERERFREGLRRGGDREERPPRPEGAAPE